METKAPTAPAPRTLSEMIKAGTESSQATELEKALAAAYWAGKAEGSAVVAAAHEAAVDALEFGRLTGMKAKAREAVGHASRGYADEAAEIKSWDFRL